MDEYQEKEYNNIKPGTIDFNKLYNDALSYATQSSSTIPIFPGYLNINEDNVVNSEEEPTEPDEPTEPTEPDEPTDDVAKVNDEEPANTTNYQYDGDKDFIYILNAQLWAESRFNPQARNEKSGAMGMAQFMPETWKEAINKGWIPEGADPYNAKYATQAQMKYMESLNNYNVINEAPDDLEKMRRKLASYNWGIGNLTRAIKRAREETGDANNWINYAPTETKNYITNILNKADEYRQSGEVPRYTYDVNF